MPDSLHPVSPLPAAARTAVRIGIDFGGTKIEAVALGAGDSPLSVLRVPTPGSYDAALAAVRDLVAGTEAEVGPAASVGIGAPGAVAPDTGIMRNANATYLNGRRFAQDLETALGRPVRLDNDANCLALSEAFDGAAAGARTVFAIIIGTGCGGGLVVDGRIVRGASALAGEWGHMPLPWASADEHPGSRCWCGRHGCLETWISGTGLRRDHHARTGLALDGQAIVARARDGDAVARSCLSDFGDRLARGMAVVADIVDPDCFVLGGGMSNVPEVLDGLAERVRARSFSQSWRGRAVRSAWGDASGVRGAARLWED
jgi:fructokinase